MLNLSGSFAKYLNAFARGPRIFKGEMYSKNGIENVPLSLRSGCCKFDLCRQFFFFAKGAGVAYFVSRGDTFQINQRPMLLAIIAPFERFNIRTAPVTPFN